MKIYTNSWIFKLPFLNNYAGIVLGRHAFFAGDPDEELIRHEMVHQRQMDEHVVTNFYIIYLRDYFINLISYGNHDEAYRNIPFEREAYGDDT